MTFNWSFKLVTGKDAGDLWDELHGDKRKD